MLAVNPAQTLTCFVKLYLVSPLSNTSHELKLRSLFPQFYYLFTHTSGRFNHTVSGFEEPDSLVAKTMSGHVTGSAALSGG